VGEKRPSKTRGKNEGKTNWPQTKQDDAEHWKNNLRLIKSMENRGVSWVGAKGGSPAWKFSSSTEGTMGGERGGGGPENRGGKKKKHRQAKHPSPGRRTFNKRREHAGSARKSCPKSNLAWGG